MPQISNETIQEVANNTDIVSLISEYTQLEQKGDEWSGCCPFHNEKTPSFRVNASKKIYHCFGCGVGGNTIKFYMEMEKLSFYEAVLALAQKSGIRVQYTSGYESSEENNHKQKEELIDIYTRISVTYHFFLTSSPLGKFAFEYVKNRGISDEMIELFQLGFSPPQRNWLKDFLLKKKYTSDFLDNSGLFSKNNPDNSFFYNRLMFPIWDRRGKVIAFGGRTLDDFGPKYINSGDLLHYKKGENLYAFFHAKQSIRKLKAVIFCEGYFDVIAYHQAGVKNAVAPLGTALTEDQIQLIKGFADTAYLSFDSDEAGKKASYKAILLCRKSHLNVKIIQLTEGKDPAEILFNQGPEILTNHVKNATIDSEYLLSTLMHQFPAHTPEGKTNICLAYFPYLDALQSDIHRDSCFEQLCQTLQLNPHAVMADFQNREQARKRLEIKTKDEKQNISSGIKPNAEMRIMLAVYANLDFFSLMRNAISADDFEDAVAKDMFITLEECYREDAVSLDSILTHLNGELSALVSKSVTSGEFAKNTKQTIEDSIRLVRKHSLERKKKALQNKIKLLQVTSLEKQQELDALVNEKMNIDNELKTLKVNNEPR